MGGPHVDKFKLTGAFDDIDHLLRIGQAGYLDDHAAIACHLNRNLAHSKTVETIIQDLARIRHLRGGNFRSFGKINFQQSLGTAAQIKP